MSAIPYPVLKINGTDTALVPVADFMKLVAGRAPGVGFVTVPREVSRLFCDGASPLKAWRVYCKLTQEELARKMGISRGAYSQMEKPGNKPHSATINNVAKALGIDPKQILELYDDEPVTTPAGWIPVDADDSDLD